MIELQKDAFSSLICYLKSLRTSGGQVADKHYEGSAVTVVYCFIGLADGHVLKAPSVITLGWFT